LDDQAPGAEIEDRIPSLVTRDDRASTVGHERDRRITLDAGSRFNRAESTFSWGGRRRAARRARHLQAPRRRRRERRARRLDAHLGAAGEGRAGNLGCAIVLAPKAKSEAQQSDTDYLLVTPGARKGPAPVVYFVGAASRTRPRGPRRCARSPAGSRRPPR
jgi:hypothetical protein